MMFNSQTRGPVVCKTFSRKSAMFFFLHQPEHVVRISTEVFFGVNTHSEFLLTVKKGIQTVRVSETFNEYLRKVVKNIYI